MPSPRLADFTRGSRGWLLGEPVAAGTALAPGTHAGAASRAPNNGEKMHPPEDDDYAFCPDCDSEVLLFDRVFPLGRRCALCFDCATQRQGVYHDLLERWTSAPHLKDLSVSAHAAASS
jgi:hypothetical protein